LKLKLIHFIVYPAAIILAIFTGTYIIPRIYRNNKPIIVEKQDQIRNFTNTVVPQPTAPPPQLGTPTPLPNYHLITTTFVPQAPEKNWDQPWQDACEEAALLTAHYYYSNKNPSTLTIKQDILKMIEYEDSQNYLLDINLIQMSEISTNYFDYQPEIISNPSVEDLKRQISLNRPVIVPANGKTLYRENKYFKNGGPYFHNVVILGYDDSKQKFTVHDVGTQFGAYFNYSYDLLIESIHDFPASGKKEDVDTGEKRVLILLK